MVRTGVSGREHARAPARARKKLVFSWKLSGLCRSSARYYPLIPSMSQLYNGMGRTKKALLWSRGVKGQKN